MAVLLLWTWGVGTADACYCGAARYRCCQRTCCPAVPCALQCYTVMKTCQETVYEPKECTFLKTEYENVVDKIPVCAVKYVEDTRYSYVCCTIMQPREHPCPEPKACAPADCGGPRTCTTMEPVTCIQKVPQTVFRPVCYQKIEEVPRVVTKLVPYTMTCYEAKVITKQVPVQVCCPVPCCCKKSCCPTCGGK